MTEKIASVVVLPSMDDYGFIPGGGDAMGGGPGPHPRIQRDLDTIYPLRPGEVPPMARVTAPLHPLFGQLRGEWAPQQGELFGAYWGRISALWAAEWAEAKRTYGPAQRAHVAGR